VHLVEPIYDGAKINQLRSRAALYIHGHSAGGTNPSLVEAMFLGLPILAFDCVYNRHTTEERCLYWSTADELFRYISNIDTYQLDAVSKAMKTIAETRYRWQAIIKKYEALYR
jgi:glycosyltransferase involved in cell wall biosynthesis